MRPGPPAPLAYTAPSPLPQEMTGPGPPGRRRRPRRLGTLEIDDSYTLLPEDQPEQLIRAIRDFVPATRRNTPLPNNDPIGPALRDDRGR